MDARGGGGGGGTEYDYPPAFDGVEAVGPRQGGGGHLVGGSNGDVSVPGDIGARALPPASRRDVGGDAGAPPPPFSRAYEYMDYGGSAEYGGGGEQGLGDARGGGHRAGLALQHVQQQEQQHVRVALGWDHFLFSTGL